MPILTYDLSYISPTLAWDRVRAWVEPSTPDGWIADGKVWLGDTPAPVASNGTGSVELTETPTGGGYQMRVDYWLPGENARRTWRSGWFEFTADADLADLVTIDVPGAPTTALGDHIASTTAHPAAHITFTPAGDIAATDVQGAIEEVATEASSGAGQVADDLTAHVTKASGAHAASAISYAGGTLLPAGTVEGALDALDGRTRYGTGMPNGFVSAPVGTRYVDTAATNGAREWYKSTGAGNTGWIVTNGDTGWRNMVANLANGWTADALLFRRYGDLVAVQVVGLDATAATSSAVVTPPTGFRCETGTRPVAALFNDPYFGAASVGGMGVTMGASLRATPGIASAFGSVEWLTREPWPTSLPGSPA